MAAELIFRASLAKAGRAVVDAPIKVPVSVKGWIGVGFDIADADMLSKATQLSWKIGYSRDGEWQTLSAAEFQGHADADALLKPSVQFNGRLIPDETILVTYSKSAGFGADVVIWTADTTDETQAWRRL